MSSAERMSSHRRVEKKVLSTSEVTDTNRKPWQYAHDLGYTDEETLLLAITNKIVCDVGSGFGTLYKTLALRGIQTKIIPVNPRIQLEEYRDGDSLLMELDFPNYPQDEVHRIHRLHDENVVVAFAHKLPLDNDSVDLVFDNAAVSYYAQEEDALAFEDSILEMIRILRPGGELRLGDWVHYGGGSSGKETFPSFQEEILRKHNLRYEYIQEPSSKRREIIGVIIYK
jgi:SAM-dependent methyltransferase